MNLKFSIVESNRLWLACSLSTATRETM